MENLFLGIDVGTGSARAGIFDGKGSLISSFSSRIKIDSPRAGFYEQSSNDIWKSVCTATREAIGKASEKYGKESVCERIKGIGIDATCSLVLLKENLEPLPLSLDKQNQVQKDDFNIIMWMDHRAEKQADLLSASNHPVLETTGGTISPEMSVAKVAWIYQQRKDLFDSAAHFIELPDFLVFKLTGCLSRSLNSLVCKWGFSGKDKWSDSFWQTIVHDNDLAVLYEKCGGGDVAMPGNSILSGLTDQSAHELGLKKGTAVAGSVIDAYAGVLATIGMKCSSTAQLALKMEKRMAIIAGTSSCHILVRKSPLVCKGVWGPYPDVLLPGQVCMEGGQSLTGKALELIMVRHPEWINFSSAYPTTAHAFEALNSLCAPHPSDKQEALLQTAHLHVLPDLHGNRSPFADASLRGIISGLDADTSVKSLQTLYLSTLLSLCYGTLHIIDSLKADIQELMLSGGMASNLLFLQLLADVSGRPVLVPKYDAVLCGSAMLGFAASTGGIAALQSAMVSMSGFEKEYWPDLQLAGFHAKKYAVFLQMYQDFFKYKNMMK